MNESEFVIFGNGQYFSFEVGGGGGGGGGEIVKSSMNSGINTPNDI